MAVTKTHPIKRALKAAIDYICNPEKTDAGDGDDDRFREAADHVEDAAIPADRRHAHLAGDLAHLRIHGTTNRTKDQGNKIFLRHLNQPFGRVASAQIGMKECRQAVAFLVE